MLLELALLVAVPLPFRARAALLSLLLRPLSSAPSSLSLRSVSSFSFSSPCILLLLSVSLYSYCWFRCRSARTGVLEMYLDHIRHKVEVQFSSVQFMSVHSRLAIDTRSTCEPATEIVVLCQSLQHALRLRALIMNFEFTIVRVRA